MPERKWEGELESVLHMSYPPVELGFAGPYDAFPGGPWDNHSYEATVLARDNFPLQYDLLKNIFNRPTEELYDLHNDPNEIYNLAEDNRYAHHLNRLRKALDQWMDETDDPGLNLHNIPRRDSS